MIRSKAILFAVVALAACTAADDSEVEDSAGSPTTAAPSFDGATYVTDAEKITHGERLAGMFSCSGCHMQDYTGADFGAWFPVVEGLWASNISVTMPRMTDAQLERLLREGVHPTRPELFVMPSKQTQFLSARDMDALIAFLRTIEPTGEATPLPPPGFEEAVTARLPADYWRTGESGRALGYHNAAEEVAYFADNSVPDLGAATARGRMVAQTVCTSCHGAALDGIGEPAGGIQGALEYDDAAFVRLLREGVDRGGNGLEYAWGETHVPAGMTDTEIDAAIAYVRALARQRSGA